MLNGIVPVVSRTGHGLLAQYGCDRAHEEAGLGRELVQPASLSLRHPVILISAEYRHGKKGDHPAVYQPPGDQRWTMQQKVSRSDLAVSKLHWQWIGIDLVPALEQTLRALCHYPCQ